ncbi:hypothetical protein ACLB2K_043169 [Fragaria x ananassa]
MSCSFTSQIPQALPSLNRPGRTTSPTITFSLSHSHHAKLQKIELPALAHETVKHISMAAADHHELAWLRIRWYKRNLLEMYFQFMFVFLFFPGILLWAPFLNFRKFPRDPNMKYPWSKPEDPDLVKAGFMKYPYAEPEDYS